MKAIHSTPLTAALVLAAAGTLAQAATAESFSLVDPVVGYWRGTATRLSACTGGVPVFVAQIGLLIQHGGTLQTTDYMPVPTDSGPGFGYWRREGHRKYFERFQFVRWNLDGTVAGFHRVTKQVTLTDRNTRSAEVEAENTDVDGNVLESFCAVEASTRWQ